MKLLVFKILLPVILSWFFLATTLSAQEPPHPPTSGHGIKGNQPAGGSAPIDGGLSVFLLMVAGYGSFKVRRSFLSYSDDI
jgi:hypothetical protein